MGTGTLEKLAGADSHFLLHDGRASTIEDAIKGHGGEAQTSKCLHFQKLLAADQGLRLIKFLESL